MISVVIPCYNSENVLERPVNALMNQSSTEFQCILVDDGSTDNTSQICDAYADIDKRFKTVHQENRGLMGAWKRGVVEADGDYIAFCDADDYIDDDFIVHISNVISGYQPDLVVYGIVSEYSNGERVKTYNKLPEGYYNYDDIENSILPRLLSDGGPQSEIIIKSRCSKAFKKSVLLEAMPILNEQVSLGEDQLTTFATIQVAKSIYCMGDYCPYHYVRIPVSMIGQFDREIFDKVDFLYREMDRIAKEYSYPFLDQVLYDRLSVTLLYVKKYICRSIDGYRNTIKAIARVRNSQEMNKCIEMCSIHKYDYASRVFAKMFFRRMYLPLYYFTRLYETIRGRDV